MGADSERRPPAGIARERETRVSGAALRRCRGPRSAPVGRCCAVPGWGHARWVGCDVRFAAFGRDAGRRPALRAARPLRVEEGLFPLEAPADPGEQLRAGSWRFRRWSSEGATAWNAGFSRHSPPQAGGGTDLMRRDGSAARANAPRVATSRPRPCGPLCRLKPAFQAIASPPGVGGASRGRGEGGWGYAVRGAEHRACRSEDRRSRPEPSASRRARFRSSPQR